MESDGIFQLNMTIIEDFYKDIVMDIVCNYFALKILGIESFNVFLGRNLHKIFHKYKSRIPCCQCPNYYPRTKHGKDSLSDDQFLLLYEKKGQPALNHEVKKGDKIVKYCLCDYSPKLSTADIDCMDIALICQLIKTCCVSYPGHPSWFDSIKDARNKIVHAKVERHLTEEMKNDLWIQLEEAVLNLASTIGDLYTESVKKRIQKMKVNCNQMEKVTKALAEHDKFLEDVRSSLQELGIKIDNIDLRCSKNIIQTKDLMEPSAVGGINPNTTDLQDEDTCYVVWRFANPGNWDVNRIKEKLKCVSLLANFKLKFVYDDSIATVLSIENIKDKANKLDLRIDHARFEKRAGTSGVKRKPIPTEQKEQLDEIGAQVALTTENDTCYVAWNLKNPGNWKVDEMMKVLKSVSYIANLKIKFVYDGSIETVSSTKHIKEKAKELDLRTDHARIEKTEGTSGVKKSIPTEQNEQLDEFIAQGLSCPMEIGKHEFPFDVIVDKRLENRMTKKVGLSYPMEIGKHEFHVDVIVDERLEYRMTNKVVRPLHEGFTINFKCEVPENGDSYRSLYALQYLSGIPGDLNPIELHQRVLSIIFDYVKANHDSEIRYDIHCRYLLTLINSCEGYVIRHLNECLLKAISNGNCQIAKAIAWKLTRMFVGMYQGLQFDNIWPGIVCHCRGNKEWIDPDDQTFCSEEVVIFVEVHSDNSIQDIDNFFGIPLQYKVIDMHSLEAQKVAQHVNNLNYSKADISMMEKISSHQAKILFSRHQNLTLISRSPIKSREFRGGHQILVNEPCIQLYCKVKGIIPVGEPHFSKMINSHPIDVLEGFSQLLVRTLSIGDEVGFVNGGSCGTLGGFLRYRGEYAFLTCAHVLFSSENLAPGADRSFIDEQKIIVQCKDKSNGQLFLCGTYADHRFPPHKSDDGVSIDAAIVKLDAECRIQNESLRSMFLNDSVINYLEIGINTPIQTMAVGAVSVKQTKDAKIKIIPVNSTEFETLHNLIDRTSQQTASTGMTFDVHLQTTLDKAAEKERKAPRIVQLFNQIAFENIDFKQGDSGMCIYAIDSQGKEGCIGMAVASHPGGGCIVTPMKSILSSFNITCKSP